MPLQRGVITVDLLIPDADALLPKRIYGLSAICWGIKISISLAYGCLIQSYIGDGGVGFDAGFLLAKLSEFIPKRLYLPLSIQLRHVISSPLCSNMRNVQIFLKTCEASVNLIVHNCMYPLFADWRRIVLAVASFSNSSW